MGIQIASETCQMVQIGPKWAWVVSINSDVPIGTRKETGQVKGGRGDSREESQSKGGSLLPVSDE